MLARTSRFFNLNCQPYNAEYLYDAHDDIIPDLDETLFPYNTCDDFSIKPTSAHITQHDRTDILGIEKEYSVLYSKLYYVNNPKYLQFSISAGQFYNMDTYLLVVDFDNGGGGTTVFLNYILSHFKKYQTFVLVRPTGDGHMYLSINDTHTVKGIVLTDDNISNWIDSQRHKIQKIFINHIIHHSPIAIQAFLSANIETVSITHDYYWITGNEPQPYFHDIKNQISPSAVSRMNQLSMLITQNIPNTYIFGTVSTTPIHVAELPDVRRSRDRHENPEHSQEPIRIAILGGIIPVKGLDILMKLVQLKWKDVEFIVFGVCSARIDIPQYYYHSIEGLNRLFTTYKPRAILELSIWNETYSYTLSAAMLTQLPIFYLKKPYFSQIEHRLNMYAHSYAFQTARDLRRLIYTHKQQHFYTIDPTLYYSRFWYDVFVPDRYRPIPKSIPPQTIAPYFIYFPQFHVIPENNLNYYDGFTDMQSLLNMNFKHNTYLPTPMTEYLQIPHARHYVLTQENIIHKQLELLATYNFPGFALYYYWFSENTVTNQHMIFKHCIDIFFSPSLPTYGRKFFFIWANENWSDNLAFGQSTHLIKNSYGHRELYDNAINLINYFISDRYLKIDNKPVLFIHHNFFMTNGEAITFYRMLEILCIRQGFAGVSIVLNSLTTTEDNAHFKNYYTNFNYKKNNNAYYDNEQRQIFIDYMRYIQNHDHYPANCIQTFVCNFDNRARLYNPNRLHCSTICTNHSQQASIDFLDHILLTYSNATPSSDLDRILLINSWNEWGENMVFEPSAELGYYYLNLLARRLHLTCDNFPNIKTAPPETQTQNPETTVE